MTVGGQIKAIPMSADNAARLEAFYGRPVGDLTPVQVAMFYALGATFVRPRDRSASHDR